MSEQSNSFERRHAFVVPENTSDLSANSLAAFQYHTHYEDKARQAYNDQYNFYVDQKQKKILFKENNGVVQRLKRWWGEKYFITHDNEYEKIDKVFTVILIFLTVVMFFYMRQFKVVPATVEVSLTEEQSAKLKQQEMLIWIGNALKIVAALYITVLSTYKIVVRTTRQPSYERPIVSEGSVAVSKPSLPLRTVAAIKEIPKQVLSMPKRVANTFTGVVWDKDTPRRVGPEFSRIFSTRENTSKELNPASVVPQLNTQTTKRVIEIKPKTPR